MTIYATTVIHDDGTFSPAIVYGDQKWVLHLHLSEDEAGDLAQAGVTSLETQLRNDFVSAGYRQQK